jgi:hypothetical protein
MGREAREETLQDELIPAQPTNEVNILMIHSPL